MNFKIDGPFSARDNDLTTLHLSHVLEKLEAILNVCSIPTYRIYGDSAYIVIDEGPLSARHQNATANSRESLENRAMSSCRETIEWDYGDIGRYFKLLDYRHVLKICKMPIAKMCVCALILRNALVWMNGCNTAEYFNCEPPTFEDWVSQGPCEFDSSGTHLDPENANIHKQQILEINIVFLSRLLGTTTFISTNPLHSKG